MKSTDGDSDGPLFPVVNVQKGRRIADRLTMIVCPVPHGHSKLAHRGSAVVPVTTTVLRGIRAGSSLCRAKYLTSSSRGVITR